MKISDMRERYSGLVRRTFPAPARAFRAHAPGPAVPPVVFMADAGCTFGERIHDAMPHDCGGIRKCAITCHMQGEYVVRYVMVTGGLGTYLLENHDLPEVADEVRLAAQPETLFVVVWVGEDGHAIDLHDGVRVTPMAIRGTETKTTINATGGSA